jgi:hypothetical protein
MGEKPSLRYPPKRQKSSFKVCLTRNTLVSEMVDLMRRLSSHLAGRRPIKLDSEETVDFSARKSCFT